MTKLDYRQFLEVMLPTCIELRSTKRTAADLSRELKENPRMLKPAEFLLLVAHECGRTYSRREKNYE